MVKKISTFLILLFALNVFASNASFYFSPVLAQSVSEEKPPDKEISKEEAKSTLKKIFETIILPFAYVFQWMIMKITGPAKISVTYSIYIDKVYKPTSRPRFFVDDPKEKVRNAKVFLPILLLHNREKVITAKHLRNTIQRELRNLSEYIKKTPMELYKVRYAELKKIKMENVKTQYGEMIMIRFIHHGEKNSSSILKLESGNSSRKITNVLPYDLSTEYRLVYEKKLKYRKDYGGKGYYGNAQKIVTYVYVEWEGNGQMKMDFSIGIGARLGWAGRTGMSYTFCPYQPDKAVEYRRFHSGNYVEQELIFKKPGWYKICMVKDEGISAL